MSIRVRTTYLAICDYPGCYLRYEFWEPTKKAAISDVIDDDEWLCLFTGDNEPRFFCPLHLRYEPDSLSAVFFRFRLSSNTTNLARSKQVLRGHEHTATTAETGMRVHRTSGSHKRGREMSLTEVCWNISSVFIVIVLGVMAVLAMLTLFAIVAAIFTSNPQDKEEHHGNERE